MTFTRCQNGGNFMFCQNCGHQLKENAKFCQNCGEKLVEERPENIEVENNEKIIDENTNNLKKITKIMLRTTFITPAKARE